jgi:hypothetical protein
MTNTLKKTVLTLTALLFLTLLSTPNAWAASQAPSSLVGERRNAKETSLERDIDGLTITCEGVSFSNKAIWVGYRILSEEDSVVEIGELTDIFDDKGRVIKAPPKMWHAVLIGGNPGNRREIIGGVSTAIAIGYCLGKSEYELAKTYARVSLNVNDQNIVFRNVPGKLSAEFDVDAYGEKVTFKDLPNEPFFEFKGHIYKIIPEAVDWNTAKRQCEVMGGHLCTITSNEEYEFVRQLLPNFLSALWFGAIKQNGVWQWITGEQFNLFEFSSWAQAQPQNANGENYLGLVQRNSLGVPEGWHDWLLHDTPRHGKGPEGYVCEWD